MYNLDVCHFDKDKDFYLLAPSIEV